MPIDEEPTPDLSGTRPSTTPPRYPLGAHLVDEGTAVLGETPWTGRLVHVFEDGSGSRLLSPTGFVWTAADHRLRPATADERAAYEAVSARTDRQRDALAARIAGLGERASAKRC